jgi:aspartyl-tRNA(Asn)/glutamyl-tRNA(Gln) amidotransferase subunit A
MAAEAAATHIDRYRRHPDDYPMKIRGLIEDGFAAPASDYYRASTHLTSYRDEIERVFVDSWKTLITPATLGPAPSADTTGDPVLNSPWSYAGLPTVSMPFARTAVGLPLAVQLVGDLWCEDDLLAIAVLLEEAIGFDHHLPPVP